MKVKPLALKELKVCEARRSVPNFSTRARVASIDCVPLLCILPLDDAQFVRLAPSQRALPISFCLFHLAPRLNGAPRFVFRTIARGSMSVSHTHLLVKLSLASKLFAIERAVEQTKREWFLARTFEDSEVIAHLRFVVDESRVQAQAVEIENKRT